MLNARTVRAYAALAVGVIAIAIGNLCPLDSDARSSVRVLSDVFRVCNPLAFFVALQNQAH
jgi:hypothetical protein